LISASTLAAAAPSAPVLTGADVAGAGELDGCGRRDRVADGFGVALAGDAGVPGDMLPGAALAAAGLPGSGRQVPVVPAGWQLAPAESFRSAAGLAVPLAPCSHTAAATPAATTTPIATNSHRE
jgi:hypothetical protein